MLSQVEENYTQLNNVLKQRHVSNQCLSHCTDCCYDHYFTNIYEYLLTLKSLSERYYIRLDYYYEKALHTSDYFQQTLKYEMISINPFTFNSLRSNIFLDHNDLDQHNLKHLPSCMMLRNGLCDVYQHRPNICRLYGTTIVCEYINNSTHEDDDKITQAVANLYDVPEGIRLPLWYWYVLTLAKNQRQDTLKLLESMI